MNEQLQLPHQGITQQDFTTLLDFQDDQVKKEPLFVSNTPNIPINSLYQSIRGGKHSEIAIKDLVNIDLSSYSEVKKKYNDAIIKQIKEEEKKQNESDARLEKQLKEEEKRREEEDKKREEEEKRKLELKLNLENEEQNEEATPLQESQPQQQEEEDIPFEVPYNLTEFTECLVGVNEGKEVSIHTLIKSAIMENGQEFLEKAIKDENNQLLEFCDFIESFNLAILMRRNTNEKLGLTRFINFKDKVIMKEVQGQYLFVNNHMKRTHIYFYIDVGQADESSKIEITGTDQEAQSIIKLEDFNSASRKLQIYEYLQTEDSLVEYKTERYFFYEKIIDQNDIAEDNEQEVKNDDEGYGSDEGGYQSQQRKKYLAGYKKRILTNFNRIDLVFESVYYNDGKNSIVEDSFREHHIIKRTTDTIMIRYYNYIYDKDDSEEKNQEIIKVLYLSCQELIFLNDDILFYTIPGNDRLRVQIDPFKKFAEQSAPSNERKRLFQDSRKIKETDNYSQVLMIRVDRMIKTEDHYIGWDYTQGNMFYIIINNGNNFDIGAAISTWSENNLSYQCQLFQDRRYFNYIYFKHEDQTFKINIFSDVYVCGLVKMLYPLNLFSKLEIFSNTIVYYENAERSSLKEHIKAKLMYRYEDKENILDTYFTEKYESKLDEIERKQNIQKLLLFIEQHSLLEIFSFNVRKNTYLLLTNAVNYKEILEALTFKIRDHHDILPMMMIQGAYQHDRKQQLTPFDIAFKLNSTSSMAFYLELMQHSDKEGHLYQEFIDKNLLTMMKSGIDLRSYFSSPYPMTKIESSYYPEYHYDDRMLLIYNKTDNLRQLSTQYESAVQEYLDKLPIRYVITRITLAVSLFLLQICMLPVLLLIAPVFWFTITYADKKEDFCGWFWGKFNESIGSLSQSQDNSWQDKIEKMKGRRFEIEYYVINLPQTLRMEDTTLFMKALDEMTDNDLSYLEILSIQTIIKFKWESYTKTFFTVQFYAFLVYTGMFVADLIIKQRENEEAKTALLAIRIICCIIQGFFLIYELRQVIFQGLKRYFCDPWDYIDLLLCSFYVIYLSSEYSEIENTFTNQYWTRTIQTGIITLQFLKIIYFLRIFDGLSFLVQMMIRVIKDLKYFVIFFVLFIVTFGLFLTIVIDDISTYEGIGGLGFFVIAYRTSVGDFDISQYIESNSQAALTWIIWFIVMFVGNIIFMNFIIAVVNESYENCMTRMVAQSFKTKVELIVERESIMSEETLQEYDYFPSYIILRKTAQSELHEVQQWQGFVKQVKESFEKSENKQIELLNRQATIVGLNCIEEVQDMKNYINHKFDKIEKINSQIQEKINLKKNHH